MKKLNNQNGRSMIEMLGVLAIIGVLSVGGIAGYSKAMMKYRINKTIEQITLITGNVRTFFANQRNYQDLHVDSENERKIVLKAKLVPDEMWNESKTGLVNIFGGVVYLVGAGKGFDIYMGSIPQEACIELLTYDWPNAIGLRVKASHSPTTNTVYSDCKNATPEAYEHGAVSSLCRGHDDFPVSIDKAVTECAKGEYIIFAME